MRTVLHHLWIIGLIFLLGSFCTIKDDTGDLAISGPNGPVIPIEESTSNPSLFASTDSAYVRVGDTISIRIRAIADTNLNSVPLPLKGLRVTATSSSGKILDSAVVTDSDGRARMRFTSATSGRAEVLIKAGTLQQVVRFEITNTPVKVQKLIQAIPDRSIIKADGEDATNIEVRVINEFHNPLVGEYVQFITSTGIIMGDGSNPENSGQSKTGSDGIARATLISSNINDTAFVTAFLVSDQSRSDEVEVEFRGMSINLLSDQTNLTSGDTAVISAKVTNGSGKAVSKSPIYFSLASGTKSNLRILSADSITNYEGIAIARIKAMSNGTDIVSVTSSGTQASIQINASNLSLALSIDKAFIQTRESDSAVVIATFRNGSGTALQNRTVQLARYYQTQEGVDTSDSRSSATDASGKSRFVITALPYECSMRLEAIAFDKTEGYASSDTVIHFITTRVMTLRGPESIAADGSSKAPVTVFIKSKNGNPVVGDIITFSTTAGMITAQSTTDSDGKAVAYLTSDRRNTLATVTATLASDPLKKQSTVVEFTGIVITANAEPPSISSNGKDTSTIFVSLTDAATIPISGERINFSRQQDQTVIISADSVTNNRGEARCRIYGKGSGCDTIRISAAGAFGSVILNYSSNVLRIDTAVGQTCIADSSDSTRILVTYLQGNKTTPIPNAPLEISVTIGRLDTLFAKTVTTDNQGKVSFYLRNPHFASTAVIYVLARTPQEITTASFPLYFKANRVKRIELSGTPEVININGGRAKITAIAYDSLGNRVKDARLSFNIINGPSGGEYLDPPVAITGDDGSTFTYLVSGKTPSFFKQVWVAAGNFAAVRSDTSKFTFAGPPKYITIRTNILKGKNPNDGTFMLPCAAIVTDVNGNPVADGTEVSFSLQISGYAVPKPYARWTESYGGSQVICNYEIDTMLYVYPFEDFNGNFHLDPGEDRNNDGLVNRGEDINGDGKIIRGPNFIDINNDGIRQFNIYDPVEDIRPCEGGGNRFVDLNNNSKWDPIEPLTEPAYLEAYYRLRADSAFHRYPTILAKDSADFNVIFYYDSLYKTLPGFIPERNCFDADAWPYNGIADPNTAVSIARTVQTINGKATNEIIYGQSDANKIEVMIWAESQGIITETPEQLILPVILGE